MNDNNGIVSAMNTQHLLDPELLPLLDVMPAFELSDELLPRVRENVATTTVLADPALSNARRETIQIPGYEGPEVRCLLYRPDGRDAEAAAYLHIHGGGYVLGNPEMADEMNLRLVRELGITVLSVDYRLAPEYPIPAPLNDCYAGLVWLHEQAAELGIDRQRIAVGGESAGGGLAAATALLARDLGNYHLCHQHLVYPMLDDRTGGDAAPGDPLTGEFVWNRASNAYGWASYLGDATRSAPQVPTRAEHLAGLPSTWLLTVALDLFRDENIDYAQRLLLAGVPTELLLYAGACHGFQGVPDTNLRRRYVRDYVEGLRKGLGA